MQHEKNTLSVWSVINNQLMALIQDGFILIL